MPAIQTLYAQDYDVFKAPFNSEEADFSGSFGKDIIVFSSTRAKTNLSFLEDTIQTYFTDLYFVRITGINALGQVEYSKPELLKGNVNTLHNEGQTTFSSDGSLMIYTGNMKQGSENKLEKVEEFKLGLFTAQQFKDSWLKTAEFPYNSRNGKYSVAHPCLSANDSILYFASNMPGGRGGSDIYRSFWKNNMWTEPENLGPEVNSRGNEFFPFINEFGVLFFSTDARDDAEGMDIYYSIEENGTFTEPQKLNGTINSEYDEFAYSEKRGVSMGTFSSNRDGGVDDVYLFAKYNSDYKNCHDNNKPTLCYRINDDKLSKLEGLPFKYQWNMGDGNMLYGNQIEYCYEKYGKYKISLNIIDTLTKQVFARVSELALDILTEEKPYISSHDTVYNNIPFECQLELENFNQFEIDKIEWILSDGTTYKGKSFSHQFDKPGNYQLKVGIIGKKKGKSPQPKMCIFKDIVCEIPLLNKPLPEVLACCDATKISELQMKYAHLVLDDAGNRLSPYYRLVVAESETPLEFSDSLFSVIAEEISELKTETGYEYTIARATDWSELLPLYQQLQNEGLQEMKAEIIGEIEYQHRLVRTGTYMPTKGAVKLSAANSQSLALGKPNRIIIHQSKEKLSFDNPLFSKIDGEITELKTENGYMYVVEAPVDFTDMTEVTEHFSALGIENPELLEITEGAWEEQQSDFGKYALKSKEP
ncbi:MAG: PKD domain-containing protein, partial [Flavobacteriales bacterium]